MAYKTNQMQNLRFTHQWLTGFGWEPTVYLPEDFVTIEHMGTNSRDGEIFLGININGVKHIFKGVRYGTK